MKRGWLWLLLVLSAVPLLASPGSYAEEQANKVVKLGFVGMGEYRIPPPWITAFWDRLEELGWIEGRNLVVERRWAKGYELLPGLMKEMVASKVDVIVTWSTPAGFAAKAATTTIPIVNAAMGDPLKTGLVTNLARPEGNLTGLSLGWAQGLSAKWVELLHETVPRLSTVAIIANPDNPNEAAFLREARDAAAERRLKVKVMEVRSAGGFDAAFAEARREAQGVLMLPDPTTTMDRQRITALAQANRLPTLYTLSDFADAGGLIVYAPDFVAIWRRAADYVDKILRGARPGDLPIEQPTQFKLVVNLKASRALGLAFPESILLRADEVIR